MGVFLPRDSTIGHAKLAAANTSVVHLPGANSALHGFLAERACVLKACARPARRTRTSDGWRHAGSIAGRRKRGYRLCVQCCDLTSPPLVDCVAFCCPGLSLLSGYTPTELRESVVCALRGDAQRRVATLPSILLRSALP